MANPLLDQREACAELPDEAVADAPAIRHQQALVVGIGQYPHVAPLANAANDARDVGKLLQDEYGFELLPRGRVCLDGEATLASLQQAMRDSLAQAGPETRWLFYFAGHGMAAGDALAGDAAAETQGYLLPVDAQRGQPATWLRLSELVRACLESACAQALIILDACYSGSALIRPNDLDDSIPVAAAAATGAPGRAHRPDPHITRRVVQIVSSGNPAQPVMDGGGRGQSVFTQSLLEALQGWAGIHEEDDGRLRFSRLLDHLVFDVPGRLRALNYSTTSQRPIGGYLRRGPSEQGDFTFRPWSGRLPARIVQAARADDPSWRQKALADLSVAKDDAARRPAGVQLASAHTLRSGGAGAPFLVTGFLDYEPVAAVRSQAAATLGELGDPAAAGALLALLDDEPPVCRTAARALARLHLPQAAGALAQRLEQAPDDLFLDLVEAIGMLAAPGSASADPTAILSALHLALQKKKLVPVIGPDFPAGLTGLPSGPGWPAGWRSGHSFHRPARWPLPRPRACAERPAGMILRPTCAAPWTTSWFNPGRYTGGWPG